MSKPREYAFVVSVSAKDLKRQQLSNGIDTALMFDGARITKGDYEVVIRRLPSVDTGR